ncbi:Proliferation-associated protein 2G4 [Acropora cervicornis]|uniref:Proliferation-associated protein 2G4 n=1 Tax=Acropora cervicornis TaxID=6130 RepID=A0AAD9UVZ7_ACRCE|nr:Proliferation-associated protein 2G4 [Acropora cervicornis]
MAGRGSDSDSEDEEPTIAEESVVTKYKSAGEIANRILRKIIEASTAGSTVCSLCQLGDKLILEETSKVFKKEKAMKKGIAFPTCISVNNCVCHFSPLLSEAAVILKDGDIVKIDLGVHIDGFIAVVGHTVVVGASKENKVTGRKADVIQAAYLASELAQRLVKAGNENFTVTDQIQKVAEAFQCKPVEGMLSHELKRNMIDGEKAIIQNPTDQQRRDHAKCEFSIYDVFAIDILMSTGNGQAKEKDTRTTIFKRTENTYNLKMKASRVFLNEVSNKYTSMPFTLRLFQDEKKAKMGLVECLKHGLVEPFSVFWEKEGEYVAQFKFTLLLMPNGGCRITEGPFDPEVIQSEYSIQDEEIKALLATSTDEKVLQEKKEQAMSEANKAIEALLKKGSTSEK